MNDYLQYWHKYFKKEDVQSTTQQQNAEYLVTIESPYGILACCMI